MGTTHWPEAVVSCVVKTDSLAVCTSKRGLFLCMLGARQTCAVHTSWAEAALYSLGLVLLHLSCIFAFQLSPHHTSGFAQPGHEQHWTKLCRSSPVFAGEPLHTRAFLGAVFCCFRAHAQQNLFQTECSNKQVFFRCTDKIRIMFVCSWRNADSNADKSHRTVKCRRLPACQKYKNRSKLKIFCPVE